jgi:hypothetical protein
LFSLLAVGADDIVEAVGVRDPSAVEFERCAFKLSAVSGIVLPAEI